MSKHVLITGGLGFIGHNLARYYLDEGYYVTIVDNLKSHHDHAALTKYRIEHIDHKKLNFVHLNCNMSYGIIDKLRSSYTRPKTIIHMAEVGDSNLREKDAYYTTSSLSSNAYSVALLAKELSAKLIYVSTSLAYGSSVLSPQKEDAVATPDKLYGLLKLNCEMMFKLINPNSVIVRTDCVYGQGDSRMNSITECIHQMLNNQEVLVKRYNENDAIHISDFIRGIKNADDHGVAGEIYNLGYGETRTDNEIVLIIKMLTNSSSVINYDFDKLMGVNKKGVLDISKAQEHLGFIPKLDIIYGLRDYIDWIRKYDHL